MDTGGSEQTFNMDSQGSPMAGHWEPCGAERPVQPVPGSAQLGYGEKTPGAADLNQVYSKLGSFGDVAFNMAIERRMGSWYAFCAVNSPALFNVCELQSFRNNASLETSRGIPFPADYGFSCSKTL